MAPEIDSRKVSSIMDQTMTAIALICGAVVALGCFGMAAKEWSEGRNGPAAVWLVAMPVGAVIGAFLVVIAFVGVLLWLAWIAIGMELE
jgi:hypothetical protein